ncbi:MAG TPA: hypothetical protein VIT92_07140 [Burkholderiaceae bacterium]
MSTFLELCQDLRVESGGIAGSGPASVTNQTGEMGKVVGWIARAYRDVQRLHQNWNFLRAEFSFPTIVSTAVYAPTAISLTKLRRWKTDTVRVYLTSVGVTDEQNLTFVPWDDFRAYFLMGANSLQAGRPQRFSVKPDNSLVVWPLPDAAYTITGEYFKRPQEMEESADVPLIPDEFQDILVWKALMYYGAQEGAPESYAFGQKEYGRRLFELRCNQLPPATMAGALA